MQPQQLNSELARAFEEGLAAIAAGGTVESFLARYPEQAPVLEPLLRLATDLGTALRVEPRAVARATGRVAVLERARRRPQGLWSWLPVPVAALGRSFVSAALVAVALLIVSSGAAVASAAALPGEPLYAIKLQIEELQVNLAATPEQKAEVALARASTRTDEVRRLTSLGRTVSPEVLTALAEQTNAAAAIAEQAGGTQARRLLGLTTTQFDVLTAVAATAPPAAQPGLERALEASRQGAERSRAAIERRQRPTPTATAPAAGITAPSATAEPGRGGSGPGSPGRGDSGRPEGPGNSGVNPGSGNRATPPRGDPIPSRGDPNPSGADRRATPTPPRGDPDPPGQGNQPGDDRRGSPTASPTAVINPVPPTTSPTQDRPGVRPEDPPGQGGRGQSTPVTVVSPTSTPERGGGNQGRGGGNDAGSSGGGFRSDPAPGPH